MNTPVTGHTIGKARVHYWTGYGTLCSLDNSRTQQPNHTPDHAKVTCGFCHHLMIINRRGEVRRG